jgi:hypothetical protein
LRISSTGNIGIGTSSPTEKLDINGNLLVRQNIISPKWKYTKVFENQAGALPISGSFTSSGGDLLIWASGSGYRANFGTLGMMIKIDGAVKGYSKKFSNIANSHTNFISTALHVVGISAGSHTLRFERLDSSTLTDSKDFFSATIMELPFTTPAVAYMCGNLYQGDSVTRVRYSTSSASTCVSEVQTSTCDSGSMTPYTGTFTNTSCTESRTRYSSSSTTCPTACSSQNQTRTCTDGSCGAWSGTYAYASCTQNSTTQTTSRRVTQTTSSQYCCRQGAFSCWRYCTQTSTSCVTSGTKSRTCNVTSNTSPGTWTSWTPADQC